jgi:hypothetical protein
MLAGQPVDEVHARLCAIVNESVTWGRDRIA